MQQRRVFGFALLSAVTWSGLALAQSKDFPAGTIALSAERLSGFSHTRMSVDVGGQTGSTKVDRFTLLGMNADGPWDLPRIGIDGFVVDHLSVGGTLYVGYAARSNDTSTTEFLLSPRVGYAVLFSNTVGIWPRGGFSYYHASLSPQNGPSDTTYYVGLELEAPFIFALMNGFAITVGPLIDLSLTGSGTVHPGNGTQDRDLSYTMFGLSAGLLGWL